MATITSTATKGSEAGRTKTVRMEFTRPANIDAYLAGDVISDATDTAKVLEFQGCGRSGRINTVEIVMEETKTADLELLLFDSEPTNLNDSDPLALVNADVDKMIGRLSFADASKVLIGTGLNHYIVSLDSIGAAGIRYASSGATKSLYGLLVTRSGYTPASGIAFHINLNIEQDED
jgi:hypothetical protein